MAQDAEMMQASLNVVPLVLSGGSGDRLWPLSLKNSPKQFLTLFGSGSLYQQTLRRVEMLQERSIVSDNVCIVTGSDYLEISHLQLKEICRGEYKILVEPSGKNTAPALTMGALQASLNGDSILVVLPSDQVILDNEQFCESVSAAIERAASNEIVLMGVRPTYPATGFGYIKFEEGDDKRGLMEVLEVTEKPPLHRAEAFYRNSNYFWNSGIFILKASVWMRAIGLLRTDIYRAVIETWDSRSSDGDITTFDNELYSRIPSESIDFAVIERAKQEGFSMSVVPLDCGWSDLGTFDAIWDKNKKDENQNVVFGNVELIDVEDSLLYSDGQTIAAAGLTGVTIVANKQGILVAGMKHAQKVRELAKRVINNPDSRAGEVECFQRPWGCFYLLGGSAESNVKRIRVLPGKRLSLQSHKFRSELWIVLKGKAVVTKDSKVLQLTVGETVSIAVGERHRLENPSLTEELEIIEVQFGTYFGEDDIERYDDDFGRAPK